MTPRSASILALAMAMLSPRLAAADLEIVTTVPDLAAIAEAIGGDKVEVSSLSLSTQDPHWVDAKPSLALRVNRADMLVAVGLSLEAGWLPTLQKGARNPKVTRAGAGYLECAGHVRLLGVPKGKIDRSMGDVHPGGNPHYLYDPRRALACAEAITNRMVALDAPNAAHYRRGFQAFAKRLAAQRAKWEARLRPHRGAKIVTYHRSWVYLADWLGLEVVATIEPKPGIPPSPSHVVAVIRAGRAAGAKVVLQESYYPSKTAKLVAAKLGAEVVSVPGGSAFSHGEDYVAHMDEVVEALARALSR